MVPTKRGYAPKEGYFNTLLDEIVQLRYEDMPEWDLVEFDPLLDSSDVSVDEWNSIGEAISSRYNDYDGFVVLHGTDTMAYSASALSFMLEGLDKPVIFTGSQIPMCQVRSDGRDNIINSLLIASQGIANEVCIFFAGKLIRGNRATKTSADDLIAFTSPNYPFLASVGIDIKYSKRALNMPVQSSEFRLHKLKHVPIAVLKLFPGMRFDLFEPLVTKDMKAVILEAFGSGNIPSRNTALVHSIRRATENGSLVAVCSQCYAGTARLGTYATSGELKDFGAVSCLDMTTEAAVAKLYYLFSLGLDKGTLRRALETNLRGEMSI
jgi:L-asparaginase